MQPAVMITPEDFPEIHSTCAKLMKEIYDEYFGNAPLRNVSIVQKFLNMLVMVGRVYTTSPDRFAGIKPTKQQEYTEKFMSICTYLTQHCTEDLTLEEVADMAVAIRAATEETIMTSPAAAATCRTLVQAWMTATRFWKFPLTPPTKR